MRGVVKYTVYAALVVPYLFVGGYILTAPGFEPLLKATTWFDELFFQYSLIIALFMVLIIPTITFVYVQTMKDEKLRRLKRELPEGYMDSEVNREHIDTLMDRTFNFKNYLGSVSLLMVVVTLGGFIILLLKPMPHLDPPNIGVDYSKGANFLMLGPFIEYFTTDPKKFYHQLIISLTAFQFGFLGAYIYFVNHLARAYFTVDLSPNTFVVSTIRLGTGSVVALVASYALPTVPAMPTNENVFLQLLPVISFIIGYFPSRGLLFLEKLAATATGWAKAGYSSTPLGELPGMSSENEIGLLRHGFDNLENLSHGDAIELAVKTGFSYPQLNQWIGRAWLRVHMGEDAQTFERATGLVSRGEVHNFVMDFQKAGEVTNVVDFFIDSVPEISKAKIIALCTQA